MLRSYYPFLLAIFFALPPAFAVVSWMIFDPDPFNPPWLIIAAPFVFAGLIGLVFRKHWALWYNLVLWIVCLLLIFYAYFLDVREEETFFPRYFWLYEQTLYFFPVAFFLVGLGYGYVIDGNDKNTIQKRIFQYQGVDPRK